MTPGASHILLVSCILLAGCHGIVEGTAGSLSASASISDGSAGGAAEPSSQLDELTARARETYPTTGAFFEQGVRRSCAGSPGTCHNGYAPPSLASVTEFLQAFNAPCQQWIGSREVIHDECERDGDRLVFEGGIEIEILRVHVEPSEPTSINRATVVLAAAPPHGQPALLRRRYPIDSKRDPFEELLGEVAVSAGAAASELVLDFTGAADDVRRAWDVRRFPRLGSDVLVADANGNGTITPELAFRQLMPGRPDRSYVIRRLLGVQFGAAMPPLGDAPDEIFMRALYCLVQTATEPSTRNPRLPIDYERCLPADVVDFTSTTYGAAQAVFNQRCVTGACHGSQPALGLDLREEAVRAGSLSGVQSRQTGEPLVVPEQPTQSYVFCKIDPTCVRRAPNTEVMPLGSSPLPALEKAAIERWIAEGALTE